MTKEVGGSRTGETEKQKDQLISEVQEHIRTAITDLGEQKDIPIGSAEKAFKFMLSVLSGSKIEEFLIKNPDKRLGLGIASLFIGVDAIRPYNRSVLGVFNSRWPSLTAAIMSSPIGNDDRTFLGLEAYAKYALTVTSEAKSRQAIEEEVDLKLHIFGNQSRTQVLTNFQTQISQWLPVRR